MALYTTTLGQKLPDTLTVQAWSTLQENANKQILEDAILDLRSLLTQAREAIVAGATPAGVVQAFSGPTAPSGFLLCEGQSLLRVSYPELFTAIGIMYGAVDVTHFNAPNYKGRALVGFDNSQTEFNQIGKTPGQKVTNQVSYANPQNSANFQTPGSGYDVAVRNQMNNFLAGNAAPSTLAAYAVSIQNVGGAVQGAGSSATEIRHLQWTTTNIQPSAVVQYIIKT